MSKLYAKPSVRIGEWYRVSGIYKTNNDEDLFIAVQMVNGEWQDHYRIYINGKAQPRKSYFGEMAYNDVIRNASDLLHWSAPLHYDGLYNVPRENVKDWK